MKGETPQTYKYFRGRDIPGRKNILKSPEIKEREAYSRDEKTKMAGI